MLADKRWTSADLEVFPDDGKRYEIIDGRLKISEIPHWLHQFVCGEISSELGNWNRKSSRGQSVLAPGLIFDESNDVAPDVIWISNEHLARALDENGHLRLPPELIVEVLSPGAENEQWDREAKLDLYSRGGVLEYWIVDWQLCKIDIYRRTSVGLHLTASLQEGSTLETPLLPGFRCTVTQFCERTREYK